MQTLISARTIARRPISGRPADVAGGGVALPSASPVAMLDGRTARWARAGRAWNGGSQGGRAPECSHCRARVCARPNYGKSPCSTEDSLLRLLPRPWRLRPRRRPRAAQDKVITVFAAASMKNALDDLDAAFTKKTGIKVLASYAASSALVKQIEQGAPADVYVSADLQWMDYGVREETHQGRHARQPARQPARADRAQGHQDRQRDDRARIRSRRSRRQGADRGRRCARSSGRPLCQGGAGEARRMGSRRAEAGDDRERARRARSWSPAARPRSASSTRPTPRSSPP